jgi:putative spermidine/putrescine transport system substrate-binding protein
MNKIFGAPEGDETLDTAFAKLSEIKEDVVTFYRTSSELINLFQMEEVWMSPAPRFSWGQFMGTGLPLAFVIPEEGVLGFFSTVSVVKNAPNRDAAYNYIDFILSNSVQTAQAMDLVDSPVNKNVVVPEDKAAFLTVGDEVASLIFYDIETIVRNREVWLEKWNKFLGQ